MASKDFTVKNGAEILSSTDATSSTTGALRVAGGLGVAKNLHVGGLASIQRFKQVQTDVSASTTSTTLDLNTSSNFLVTLSSNTTFTISNLSGNIGASGYILLQQDATGTRTITLPSTAKTPNGQAISQYTAANSLSLITYYVVAADKIILTYIGNFA